LTVVALDVPFLDGPLLLVAGGIGDIKEGLITLSWKFDCPSPLLDADDMEAVDKPRLGNLGIEAVLPCLVARTFGNGTLAGGLRFGAADV
jgi:hypothetical protein